MRLLLDTHLLLWAALGYAAGGNAGETIESTGRMSAEAAALIDDPANEPVFSVASIWEVAIKTGLGRPNFKVNPAMLRRGLLENGYIELPVTGGHAIAVANLPHHHKDPFDRILLAQATVEGITLLTVDARLAAYPGPVRRV